MPYQWTAAPSSEPGQELRLWPYNALSRGGVAAMGLVFFAFATMPLIAVLGSGAFWGLLPFLLVAMWGLDYALRRNRRDRHILEVLTITDTTTTLTRTNPGGDVQTWQANTYWVAPHLHLTGGPVPFYVTLKGAGREVEIGAFLSEDERKALHSDLHDRLRDIAQTQKEP